MKIGSNHIKNWQENQQELLQQQILYIAEHSPYYQRIFKENKLDISDFSLVDFSKLPITTKEDLARYNDEFVAVPQSEIIDIVTTSGTLGEPVSFALNEDDLQRLATNEEQSFQQIGITKNDVVQITTTLDRQFVAGLAYFLGLRKLGAGIIRLGAGIPELQWKSILRFQPTYLISVPSFLLKLIDYAEKNGIDCNKTSIKGAICIGEPIRNENFELNPLGQKITAHWGIELFSTYASTEMCTAFTECKAHEGNHIQEDLIFTEVLDDNGNPVKDGEIGELTITTLGVQTMPLLRYQTGDMVKKISSTCSCGKNGERISAVLGRKKQLIKYKGTSIYPLQILNALASFPDLKNYLIIASSNSLNEDVLSVVIEYDTTFKIQQNLREHLQATIRVIPELVLWKKETLQQAIFNPKSRKPIRFLDKRN
ncbi:phenylacetate--CoA ligase family protein [Mesonia aquimarina]|uniref:phenylacetate--CoA ligase family protein n=1 Tax=Mesonia aquimarina TaxID=1504967 RepID=UPI000EF61B62|nr:AMP-binding protein [Mesonia aquimarina]